MDSSKCPVPATKLGEVKPPGHPLAVQNITEPVNTGSVTQKQEIIPDLLQIIIDKWKTDERSQYILGCWIVGFVGASVWGLYLRKKAKKNNKIQDSITCMPNT